MNYYSPYPTQPVFIPNPPQAQDPSSIIEGWIRLGEVLKRAVKEGKAEEHKKKEPKILSEANMVGLILLLSIPVGIAQLGLLYILKEAVLKLFS